MVSEFAGRNEDERIGGSEIRNPGSRAVDPTAKAAGLAAN